MSEGLNPATIENWIEHRREGDGELVGFLAPVSDSGRFLAMTVFGSPLTEPSDRAEAEDVLDTSGLSYLADRWLLQIDELTRIEVEIVEASPERVVVHNVDFGSGLDHGHRFSLAAPAEGRLTRA